MTWTDFKRLTKAVALIMGRVLYVLYPMAVLLIVLILFPKWASAGQIRHIILTPEKPGVVNLAFGNATAVSFQSKPEKLVPGSPQKVEINFLGKDITISPLAPSPGNLLIYTGGTRYVLLFRIVPEAAHDDVVEISEGSRPGTRAIRLDQDTYHIEEFQVVMKPRNKKASVKIASAQGIVYENRISGDEISEILRPLTQLRCEKCAVQKDGSERLLVCTKPIPNPIKCQSADFREIGFMRGPS